MTDEKMRIAIAEACGWKLIEGPNEIWFHYNENGRSFPQGATATYNLPDYLNDLNAMHVAERTCLIEMKDGYVWRDYRHDYNHHLWSVCSPIKSGEENGWSFPEFAKAKHKAEALLKTLGLWEESK